MRIFLVFLNEGRSNSFKVPWHGLQGPRGRSDFVFQIRLAEV